MVQYQKLILNHLIDSYERSLLSIGENKVNIRIAFPFTKKNLPEYFNESSLVYEDIHACMGDLQQRGWIQILWKKGQEGNIIQKVCLNVERVDEVYQQLKRMPKKQMVSVVLTFLQEMKRQAETPVCNQFLTKMIDRLQAHKSVKEYLDLEQLEETGKFIHALMLVEQNETEYYLREFSITHFSDSKYMERVTGRLARIFKEYIPDMKDMDAAEILAEYSIYHTPNFIYFKGSATLKVQGETINLRSFPEGIGLTGAAVSKVQIPDIGSFDKVITIENLTTFFRWQEERSLIIYLGGYHNKLRCQLLKIIYQAYPKADYFHFGDIDCGGFRIYENLCRKTGIPFRPYYMDQETFQHFQKFSKSLTENDRKNISKMLAENPDAVYTDVLLEMLGSGRKLEQECILSVREDLQ